MDEFEDDIFDRNIDQLDVRETPRWELSEEEDEACHIEPIVNQQSNEKIVAQVSQPGNTSAVPKITNIQENTRATVYQPQPGATCASLPRGSNVPAQPQSPILSKGGPRSSTSTTESVKTVMSPILLPRNLDKKKIEQLVKAAYNDEGDSVKDFGAAEREKRPATKPSNKPSKDTVKSLPPWEDDDADSIKDYTGNDRKKEEQYMVRTDEAIYQRASEEHIKRPPLWHDDELDSLRDFGRISGKHEVPSGILSQQLSRVPSDEEICLSPPWIEEEDPQPRNVPCPPPQNNCKRFAVGKMMAEQRIQQVPVWHDEDIDCTRNYAEFWKLGSKENSRRPSDENIYLTPPWMEDDRESCGNHSMSSRTTVDEKCLMEGELRVTTLPTTSAQPVNEDQNESNTENQLPGRDSGFCSEQDQHQQTQVCVEGQEVVTAPNTGISADIPCGTTVKKPITEPPLVANQLPAPVVKSPIPSVEPKKKLVHEDKALPSMFLSQPPLIDSSVASEPDTSVPMMPSTNICGVKGIARSISQSSLEANCYSPHDALEGLETSSVVSFASTAATHHDLDTRIDMMQSLISLLGTHDKDDLSRTLLAMSNSKDSCAAMRQSGCLPLLIDLIHGHENPIARRDCRSRAGLALHNIVYSNPEDRRGRREIRVLRLLEIVRAHCDAVMYSNLPPHPCAERWYPPLRDYGPGPAVAALMKLSFEEEHRTAICELGGCQAVAELVEIDHKVNAACNDLYSVSLRKYAGMTLTNLTFGNTRNKTILCKMDKTVKALISQLKTTNEEELVQVSASVLRNLSWRADELSRDALRKVGAVRGLIEAAQKAQSETVLRTLLSGLWNLSAHCPENKTELCNIPGALKFIVKSLSHCSPSGSMSVIESSGGILRNLSSHIAVLPECRKILRENGCFQTLLTHLRSTSIRVVSNACGALWNLSARCIEDQELLWELGAVSILKTLVNSKHKAIATASAAALRNLMAVKPITSRHGSDSESSSASKRLLSQNTRHSDGTAKSKPSKADHHSLRVKPSTSKASQHASPRSKSPEASHHKRVPYPQCKDALLQGESSSSVDEAVRGKAKRTTDQRLPANHRKSAAVDSSSMGSSDGRHGHLARWSGSNDSLAQHRRQKTSQQKKPSNDATHSRSSSDGCTVLQLLTDGYPLQVTSKTNNNDNPPIVSPATARRLNQWAEDQAIESIEMSHLYICSQPDNNRRHATSTSRVAESRESLGSSSSRHRKKHAQKFRSYRDSESEREADIDSDEEKNVFGLKAGGFANAWIKKSDNRSSNAATSVHPSKAQETTAAYSKCVCKEKRNIWMRKSKSDKRGVCKKCMKKDDTNEATRPVVKSRRDSSDSPLSSPNAGRGYPIEDPSQRGVKVTSL